MSIPTYPTKQEADAQRMLLLESRIAALEKLCRKQHEALEIANGLHPCPLYADAVTAYTTLFLKTGGA